MYAQLTRCFPAVAELLVNIISDVFVGTNAENREETKSNPNKMHSRDINIEYEYKL